MSYKSPLHIIKGLATEANFEISEVNLIRLRKQLLAELNLSGEPTITVNKKQYSKDEIIKTIDILLTNPNLDVHEFIFNTNFILKYLEDESQILSANLYLKLNVNENIKGKLENIIYGRFISQLKKGLSTRNFSQAEGAVVLMKSLSENYKNECYEEVHKSLYTFSNYLLELQATVSVHSKNDLMFLTYQSLALFLNSLPEQFDDLKNEITGRIINLVVGYHKLAHHKPDITKGISTMLLKIKCEEEHSKLIRNNHKVFSNSGGSSGSSETAPWRIIIFVIIVLVNVLRMCSKSNHTYNDSNNFSNSSDYNNITEILKGKSTYLNSYAQLESFRTAVTDEFEANNNKYTNMYDTAHFHTGNKPFHNNLFYVTDTSYANWKHTMTINNKTNYDLIVMYFDSTNLNFISCFIEKNNKFQLAVTNRVNMVFYFGNNLLEVKAINERHQMPTLFPEFFANVHQSSITLLYKTYVLTIPKQKSKKIKPVKCTLDLDSTFIAGQKNKYEFKKFTLTQVEGVVY